MSTLRLVPTSGPPFEVTKDSALIGREPSCDISITDGSISRRHAKIEKRGDGWAVVDQASANGTFIDSQKVGEADLKSGQELRLGAVAFKVEIIGAAAPMDDPGATVLQPVGVPMAPSAAAPPAPKPAAPAPPPPPKPAAPKAAAPPPPPPKAAAPPRPVAPPPKPAAPASAGAKKGKGPIFWIGTGCCGCLTLVLLLVAGIFGAAFWASRAPVTAVRTQLTEIKSGQIDAAYGRLSQTYQYAVSRSDFERMIAAHPSLRDNADSTFTSWSVKNNMAHLEGSLTSAANEKETVTYDLINEGGDGWKIMGIRFAGDDITVPDMGGGQQ